MNPNICESLNKLYILKCTNNKYNRTTKKLSKEKCVILSKYLIKCINHYTLH
jgi:hypothetical protein